MHRRLAVVRVIAALCEHLLNKNYMFERVFFIDVYFLSGTRSKKEESLVVRPSFLLCATPTCWLHPKR